ncbi:MAG: L,D-transpeptidase [Nitrospirae bacterium]|nr:MAG: L,D-transpeptidase [Nitrospirota bacterium]TLY42506.1 MAG: L,D-transpeptidase [Nitrospirota bacterium]
MEVVRNGWLKKNAWAAVLVLVGALPIAGFESEAPREQEVKPSGIARKAAVHLEGLRIREAALRRQLAALAPTGSYIVVDTARNRLYVRRRSEVLLAAVASTGSGTILDYPDRPGARWVFDTPRGEFMIQSKFMNPVWVKPDWAFVEEGLEVPADPAQRVEAGMLGDYALGFGNGFFIHGTLYTRLLGKNVTHGCVRLNDEDLRSVYRLADIGTPLMIF